MGLPKVDSFLCCISLDTGCKEIFAYLNQEFHVKMFSTGLVIGWVAVIISVISMTGLSLTTALYALGIAHISRESIHHIIFVGKISKCGKIKRAHEN
jgi:hypothetical protein